MIQFKISNTEYIELCNLLKATGLCESGAQAKHEIANEQVKVNNQIETRKKCKIRPGQTVQYKNQEIQVEG